jgi:hypothetical protein
MTMRMIAIAMLLGGLTCDVSSEPAHGTVLLEFFTSEGCSSCPPADRLLTKLANERSNNVIAIGYHVDYWNRLGWTDRFSKSEFSERQERYARLIGVEGIYTPQVVINGKLEMVGSDERAVRDAIEHESHFSRSLEFTLSAQRKGDLVEVDYRIAKQEEPLSLTVVEVERHAQTDVRSGENSGRNLVHSNIVCLLKSVKIGSTTGQVLLADRGRAQGGFFIAAFIQSENGHVLSVKTTEL